MYTSGLSIYRGAMSAVSTLEIHCPDTSDANLVILCFGMSVCLPRLAML